MPTDKRLSGRVANFDWKTMPPPVTEGSFVRPAKEAIAQPIWGHADGIRVGLYPMRGPRGLIRVYAPFLGHGPGRMINHLAIEPIREREKGRGFSEMEASKLEAAPGLRFWAADTPDPTPRLAEESPARGVVTREGEVDVLRLYIHTEPYRNGTHPYVRLTFRSDQPYEVGVAVFAHEGSAPMSSCVITATMANYARLRRLHLAESVAVAGELWPDYSGDRFTPHRQYLLRNLHRTPTGAALVAITSDESDPRRVVEGFPSPGWIYEGPPATQYWRCDAPDPALRVLVNGRHMYWNSKTPIPGGTAFENFEMVSPYKEGQEFWFGVTPRTPMDLGLPAVPGPTP